MKKECALTIIAFLAILFTTSFALAAENQSASVQDTGYECLKATLDDNCGNTQNTELAAFSLLAMAYDSKVQSECKNLLKGKINGDCWGTTASTSCDIKSTALGILALLNINEDVDDQINWLLSKRQLKTGLTWYLEIDSNNQTECNINGKKIIINENKKIGGSDPAGLVKAYNDNWFEIKDISKNYTISCDQDFITTLLYKKPASSVFYVSNRAHSAVASDSTEEKVDAYCFATGVDCDYEGSLWAALALAKKGEDISSYLPYIAAMSDETANKKYLPTAFLVMLTHSDDYFTQLSLLQQNSKYWDASKDKLYDTSIAILALQDFNSQEMENAKKYFLSIQEASGCWSSNTALILWSTWPRNPADSGGSSPVNTDCETYNYFCTSALECSQDKKLENFYCSSAAAVCCETKPEEESCSEKGGIKCEDTEECSTPVVSSLDIISCCTGSCQSTEPISNACEDAGNTCKSACADNDEEKSVYNTDCSIGQKCCGLKPASSTNWLLIGLLILLIILVILAIIFRNQLKIWVFKVKSGFKSGKGPAPTTRPTSPPPGYRPMPPQGQMRQPLSSRPPIQRRPMAGNSQRDKDFEDTMKKLRDMSK
ncbi:MAG: hypothetical protein WC979_04265 [Candidatus Pacearchaeota archaeon]|jgi:hypothetical protein